MIFSMDSNFQTVFLTLAGIFWEYKSSRYFLWPDRGGGMMQTFGELVTACAKPITVRINKVDNADLQETG